MVLLFRTHVLLPMPVDSLSTLIVRGTRVDASRRQSRRVGRFANWYQFLRGTDLGGVDPSETQMECISSTVRVRSADTRCCLSMRSQTSPSRLARQGHSLAAQYAEE